MQEKIQGYRSCFSSNFKLLIRLTINNSFFWNKSVTFSQDLNKISMKNRKKEKIIYRRFFTGTDFYSNFGQREKNSNLKRWQAKKAHNNKIIKMMKKDKIV